jgi:hypothetical protein
MRYHLITCRTRKEYRREKGSSQLVPQMMRLHVEFSSGLTPLVLFLYVLFTFVRAYTHTHFSQ